MFHAVLGEDQPGLQFVDNRQRFALAADAGEIHRLLGYGPGYAIGQPVVGCHQQQARPFARRTAADRGSDIGRNGRAGRIHRTADLEDEAFGGGDDLGPTSRSLAAQSRQCHVDFVIAAHRVVVSEGNAPCARRARDQHGIIERAVPPAALGGVFLRQILGIVDDQIDARHEIGMREVFALERGGPVRHVAGVRFVIAGIDNGCPVAFDAERQRQRRMVEIARLDRDIVDHEAPFAQVVVAHGCAEGLGRDREIGVFHLPGECVLERFAEALRRVEIPLVAGNEERREERDALDMIPVGVADQHMPARRLAFAHDRLPKLVPARPAVDHEPRARSRPDFDARGVAAVTDRPWSRLRKRPARAPEAHLHCPFLLSKI